MCQIWIDYYQAIFSLTKLSILDQNLILKFLFGIKISIFSQNFDFWPKFRSSTKVSLFDQNFDFRPKFQFSGNNFDFSLTVFYLYNGHWSHTGN